MAYKVIILYRLYMPSYVLGTFTEYPENKCIKSQGLLLVLHWLLIHFVVFVHIIVLSL